MSRNIKKTFSCGALLTLVIIISILCAVPPVSRDALTHHLAVPKLYIEHGGIYELPEIVPSYYPQLLDLVYCIPLMFQNDILPKYIHFIFALLTSFIIFIFTQKRLGFPKAVFTVIFFLSLPIILKLSTEVYVDLGLVFFSFGSLYFLLRWRENNYNNIFFFLSALFCGLSLSTKYNGLITLFFMTGFVPFVFLNRSKKNISNQVKAIAYGLAFLLISLIIFSPWMVKNFKWTQNPVYPLYEKYFNQVDTTASENASNWNHFHTRKFIHKETWWETLLIPIRIFFQGQDGNPKYFDGKLNPFLFFLPFFAFFNPPSRASGLEKFEKKVLLSFSFLFITFVFLQVDMRIRWMAPAIPPLVILSAFGLNNIYLFFKRKLLKIIILIILIFGMGLNLNYLYKRFDEIDPLPYITKKVTRDEYIQTRRPEYKTIQYANLNLQKNAKILALFLGDRRYYFDRKVSFKLDLFKNIIGNSKDSSEAVTQLKSYNFTDILTNDTLFYSWINQTFNIREIQIVHRLFKQHSNKLFHKDGHGLYHLK